MGFAMSNPRNLFHCVGPQRANPRYVNESWALMRRTRGALRQRGFCASRPTLRQERRGSCASRPTLRQKHVGPARQDPRFDKCTWVLHVTTRGALRLRGSCASRSTLRQERRGSCASRPTLPSFMAGSPALREEFVASAIVWPGARSGGGGEVRKRTAPRRHVTPTRARPDTSRGTVISLSRASVLVTATPL